MRVIAITLAVLMAVTVAMACEGISTCPVHDSPMTWTGQTKAVNGHQFGLYRCVRGDTYWVRCD